ncbi:MAG: IclR family transcriptional regulator [Alphaproteobacteria bacterium]|nr:IclR family transcriptional regulator [Alphaproteobacteria bacterium]MBO6863226.1 IclR family transcriptional regulator [Alphaproteobacteria bacterium]MEC9265641.1 IclR family transcriptional regulator [Pseudomonadota bacterium]
MATDSDDDDTAARRRSVQSITVGSALLDALADSTGPMPLRILSKAAGMHPSKARRYLVSFLECGLVEQKPDTGCYDLGPMALRLGFAAMSRLDPIRESVAGAEQLARALDRTVMVSVWSNLGPIVIAWYDASEIVACNLRVGSVLPLIESASGKLFLTHLPEATTAPVLKKSAERATARKRSISEVRAQVSAAVDQVRQERYATTAGDLLPGLNAIGAPVFNSTGAIVAVIAEIHRHDDPAEVDGVSIHSSVLEKAAEVSVRLGHR